MKNCFGQVNWLILHYLYFRLWSGIGEEASLSGIPVTRINISGHHAGFDFNRDQRMIRAVNAQSAQNRLGISACKTRWRAIFIGDRVSSDPVKARFKSVNLICTRVQKRIHIDILLGPGTVLNTKSDHAQWRNEFAGVG